MSLYGAFIEGFVVKDYHTETAATAIDEQIPGSPGLRLALISFEYLAAATAHTLSFMYPGNLAGCRTTASADAAISQKVLNATDAPTDPAGNAAAASDIIAYYTSAGWEFNTVASLATKAITLTTNIASPVASGAPIRIFGVTTDNSRFIINGTASTAVTRNGYLSIVCPFVGDPMYFSSNNATNAGFLNNMVWAYINK